jgi:hypothetical protein
VIAYQDQQIIDNHKPGYNVGVVHAVPLSDG